MDKGEMRTAVHRRVLAERQGLGIRPVDRRTKLEFSGAAFGEFATLLHRQLLTTEEGFGGWHPLEHSAVLERVHLEVSRQTTAGSS